MRAVLTRSTLAADDPVMDKKSLPNQTGYLELCIHVARGQAMEGKARFIFQSLSARSLFCGERVVISPISVFASTSAALAQGFMTAGRSSRAGVFAIPPRRATEAIVRLIEVRPRASWACLISRISPIFTVAPLVLAPPQLGGRSGLTTCPVALSFDLIWGRRQPANIARSGRGTFAAIRGPSADGPSNSSDLDPASDVSGCRPATSRAGD
jgi:hypothetical protein